MPELVHSHLNFPDEDSIQDAVMRSGAVPTAPRRAERARTHRGRVRGASVGDLTQRRRRAAAATRRPGSRGSSAAARSGDATRGASAAARGPDGHRLGFRHGERTRAHGK